MKNWVAEGIASDVNDFKYTYIQEPQRSSKMLKVQIRTNWDKKGDQQNWFLESLLVQQADGELKN